MTARMSEPQNDTLGVSKAYKLASLRDLYVDELKDLYSAEQQITKALPHVIQAAASQKLKAGLQHHLEETVEQIRRLEHIFAALGVSGNGKMCHGMKGILDDRAEMVEEDAAPHVKDAGLISSAQRVEHYEMAGYGCVIAYADTLGEKDAVKLLRQTLAEEKKANETLNNLSGTVNHQAAEGAHAGMAGSG